MIARRLVISGRVQGVGFRESLVDVAMRERAAGWVRNVHDGTVEAFVQGDEDAIERITAWCGRGPPAARVTAIDVVPADVDRSLTGFRRRPTA